MSGPAMEGLLRRHLLPGETVVSHYIALETSAKGFRPVLTDQRLLFVGKNTAEDMHLNAISSMSVERKRRFGRWLLALGILLTLVGFLVVAFDAGTGLFLLFLGVVLIILWAVVKRDLVQVFGGGRQLEIRGPAHSLDEFMREVRLQQQKFTQQGQGGPQ